MTRLGRRAPCALALLLASSLAACGDDDGTTPVTDGGPLPDGAPSDGGAPDTGEPPIDGDVRPDGEVPPDGGDDGGPPIDGGSPFEIARVVCESLARAECTVPWDCGCEGFGEPPPDEAACITASTTNCLFSLMSSGLGSAIAIGRVTVDMAVLEECSRRVDAAYATCSGSMMDFNVWCHRAFVDSARIGESCLSDSLTVCAGGDGICSFPTCVPRTPAGGACSDEELPRCAGDLTCHGGTCVAPRVEGESCDRHANCASGLLCAGGTCRAMFTAAGSACTSTGECEVGAVCADSTCTTSVGPRGCTTDDMCGSGESCQARTEGRCRPPIEVGMFCDSDACVSTAYCDFSINRCVLRPGDGEACPWGWCAEGFFCGDSGTCRAPSSVGGPCSVRGFGGEDGCQEGLSCVLGACEPTPGYGGRCGDDGECQEGLECLYTPEPTCSSPRGPGEMCDGGSDGNDCYDGYFCDYTTFTCAPVRGEGETCFGSAGECGTGHDCNYDPVSGMTSCMRIPSDGEPCTWICTEPSYCVYVPVDGTCQPDVCRELPGFGGGGRPPRPPPTPIPAGSPTPSR